MAKLGDPNSLNLRVTADALDAIKEFKKLTSQIGSSISQLDGFKTKSKHISAYNSYVKRATSYMSGFTNKFEALNNLSKSLLAKVNDVGKGLANAITSKDAKAVKDLAVEYGQLTAKFRALKDLSMNLVAGKEIFPLEKTQASVRELERFEYKLREIEIAQAKQRAMDLKYQGLTTDKDTLKSAKELSRLQSELERAKEKFYAMSAAGKNTKGIEKYIKLLSKRIREFGADGKKSDGVFKKLWGRIRNVSIYRSIRTVLKSITQGFEEGINNFVQYSDEANATMSNINGSLQQIRNTMGIAMVSALQALEPIIISASNALINLLDAFNLAMAKMAGKTTYNKAIKNVDDYAASVDNAKGALADFDKFRTLDAEQTDPTEMFSEEKIDENESRLSDFFGSILKFIKEIWNTISTVWQDLTDLGIWDILIDVFGDVADIIAVVVKLIGGIIKGLHDMGALKTVLYGLIVVWGLYKAAAMSAAAANALAWVTAHPILGITILGGALAALTGIISSFSNITSSNITSGGGFATVGLADGGFTTANFIATNENGVREWVGSNGSATAVVNDTQMSDIMYQAVKDGCYEGVVDALSDANSYSATNNDNSVATVEIQGETLFTIVRNVAQKQGLKFSRV